MCRHAVQHNSGPSVADPLPIELVISSKVLEWVGFRGPRHSTSNNRGRHTSLTRTISPLSQLRRRPTRASYCCPASTTVSSSPILRRALVPVLRVESPGAPALNPRSPAPRPTRTPAWRGSPIGLALATKKRTRASIATHISEAEPWVHQARSLFPDGAAPARSTVANNAGRLPCRRRRAVSSI